VDSRWPEPDVIMEAVEVLKSGGVIIFPTSGLYGMGADAFNVSAALKIYHLKERVPQKPLLILVSKAEEVTPLVKEISPEARILMDHFWPGSVTLVFPASASVPDILTGGTGKIGIRQVKHPVAAALTAALGIPLIGTSANRSGFPSCNRIDDMDSNLINQVDLVMDAGALAGAGASTVVDVTKKDAVILRVGVVSMEEIRSVVPLSGDEIN
jgi:L-threonylcarbamoyladenylate synthase